MAVHLKMTYKKGHLMVTWVSCYPHTLSFLEGERMRYWINFFLQKHPQPFRWLQWELHAALLSELLVTYVRLWKTLYSFSMQISVLEEADSNKLAIFSKTKQKKSYLTAGRTLRCSLVGCQSIAQRETCIQIQTGNSSTKPIKLVFCAWNTSVT